MTPAVQPELPRRVEGSESPTTPEFGDIPEVYYRAAAPVLGHFPGHHRSRRGDSGFEFRGHASLLDAPDPRRLDLHASLRDPFGGWRVRLYSQRMAMPVVVVADLSASMGFEGRQHRTTVLADLVQSLALSAWRTGDRFGFVGCDTGVRSDWLLLPTRVRGAAEALAQALRAGVPMGASSTSATGLGLAASMLGRQRALVLLVSDFHLPPADIDAVLASLAAHDVVPVVLWDTLEYAPAAQRGLLHTVDPESGRRRLVWWRPALRVRWQGAVAQRRARLQADFAARRLRPLFIEGAFDADAVTRHFHP
ncbi:MAG: MxaS protein [Rubrivivax sp.]